MENEFCKELALISSKPNQGAVQSSCQKGRQRGSKMRHVAFLAMPSSPQALFTLYGFHLPWIIYLPDSSRWVRGGGVYHITDTLCLQGWRRCGHSAGKGWYLVQEC